VGIYYSADPLGVPEAGFLQAVHVDICQRLAAEGIALTVYHDPRSEQEQAQGEPLPELRRHARQRAIQGLIVPSCSLPLYGWTSRLPIPVAYATSATIPNRVTHDMRSLANQVCAYVRDAGYRSIGLISICMPSPPGPHPLGADVTLPDYWPIAVRQHGLETRPEWVVYPQHDGMEAGTVEHFGFAAWRRFWHQPTHPQALLAHTDVAARGVLLGLLADGVRVPDELAFIYHQNSGRPLLCPVPAAIIESDTRAFADGLVDQLLALCRGEQVTPRQAPFRLFPPVPVAPRPVRR
jgi:DNA-binding LacI/PurR family transcriptional regulator